MAVARGQHPAARHQEDQMSKKIIKQLGVARVLLLTSFVIGLLFFSSFIFSVQAETKNAGPLTIEYAGSGPLFSANNIAPGYSETKTLTITNNGTVPHSFAIAVSGALGELADVLRIAPKVLGVAVWDETISSIATYPDSSTIIGSIAPGGTATVDLVAYLPETVGNNYQGKTTLTFDFVVGDQEEEPAGGGGGGEEGTGGPVGGRTLGAAIPGIAQIAGESIAPEDKGEVAGEEEDKKGEENGDQDADGEKGYSYLYWLIPLIILILLFLWWLFGKRRRRDENEETL